MKVVAEQRGSVARPLQSKLLQFLRFTLSREAVEWPHVARVLAWPLWPAEGALELAASCLFELFPWSLAWHVLHAHLCASLLAEHGTSRHAALAGRIRSGETRACLAAQELMGGCATTAVTGKDGFVLSSNGCPKLLVSRGGCDTCLVLARVGSSDGPLALFAVEVRTGGGQLVPGVQWGSVGEEEPFGWVRFYDVQIRRDSLLNRFADVDGSGLLRWDDASRERLRSSLGQVHAVLARAATAALGAAARAGTRFALDQDQVAEKTMAQGALMRAHASLFAADLAKTMEDEWREPRWQAPLANFVCRHSAAHLGNLLAMCRVSGTIPVNTLAYLLRNVELARSVSGSMRPLTDWVASEAERRYGGVTGALRWLQKRAILFVHRVVPASSDSATLRSYEFQTQALRFRLLTLVAQLLELPRSRWRSNDDLVTAVGDTFVMLRLLKRFDLLEEAVVDERVAAMVCRVRSLFVLSSWDELFLVREGYIGASQARALEVERAVLVRELLCDVEALAHTSRDALFDVLPTTPLGCHKYSQGLFEWVPPGSKL